MQPLYFIALLIVAAISTLGVLHPRYDDTVLQRTGMGVSCLGAACEIWMMWQGYISLNAHALTMWGVAVFALGTMAKKITGPKRKRRAGDCK